MIICEKEVSTQPALITQLTKIEKLCVQFIEKRTHIVKFLKLPMRLEESKVKISNK